MEDFHYQVIQTKQRWIYLTPFPNFSVSARKNAEEVKFIFKECMKLVSSIYKITKKFININFNFYINYNINVAIMVLNCVSHFYENLWTYAHWESSFQL